MTIDINICPVENDDTNDDYQEIYESVETDSIEASLVRGDKVKAAKPSLTFSLGDMLKKVVGE